MQLFYPLGARMCVREKDETNAIKVFFFFLVLIRRCSFLGSLRRRWVEPEPGREVCGRAEGTGPD